MKDQISALMDDEFDTDTADHLFKALNGDRSLNECWAVYHLIGDTMRGAPQFSPDFESRLLSRIEAEPTVLAPRRRHVPKPSHMMSAAASVAAVLFVGWMVMQQQNATSPDAISAPSLAQNNVSPESVNSYLAAHHELSPELGMQSAYYVRPVAYAGSGN